MLKMLGVETSGICNLDCNMCPRKSFSNKGGLMDERTFNNVLEVFKSVPVEYAYLTGYGEPLLDKNLFARIETIHKVSPATAIGFNTNGVLLNEENIAKIKDSYISALTVSLDAGTRETYAAIRGLDVFPLIMENLRRFTHNRGNTPLSANAVITKCNLHEMEEIVRRCLELGIPLLSFSPMCVYSTREQLDLFIERALIAKEYLRLREYYDGKITLTAWNLDIEKKYGNCWAEIPERPMIDWTGNVYPCCVHQSHAPRHALDGSVETSFVKLGSINTDSFENSIAQPVLHQMLDVFKHGDMPKQCKNCFLAREFSKKELIEDYTSCTHMCENRKKELDELQAELALTKRSLAETTSDLETIRNSRSWLYTKPLRTLASTIRSRIAHGK